MEVVEVVVELTGIAVEDFVVVELTGAVAEDFVVVELTFTVAGDFVVVELTVADGGLVAGLTFCVLGTPGTCACETDAVRTKLDKANANEKVRFIASSVNSKRLDLIRNSSALLLAGSSFKATCYQTDLCLMPVCQVVRLDFCAFMR